MIHKTTFTLVLLTALAIFVSCDKKEIQLIRGIDGSTTIFDSENKQLLIVGQSNRIIDVVDLKLTAEQVASIKLLKELNDKKVKVNRWDSFKPPKEKYEITFATRYYNDQCFYQIIISPWDNRLQQRQFSLKHLSLYDSAQFTLEEIYLPSTGWSRLVDDEGKPTKLRFDGKLPMTLDNYMEIANWTCSW